MLTRRAGAAPKYLLERDGCPLDLRNWDGKPPKCPSLGWQAECQWTLRWIFGQAASGGSPGGLFFLPRATLGCFFKIKPTREAFIYRRAPGGLVAVSILAAESDQDDPRTVLMVLEALQRYPRPKLCSSSSHEDPRQPPGWDSRLPKQHFPVKAASLWGGCWDWGLSRPQWL